MQKGASERRNYMEWLLGGIIGAIIGFFERKLFQKEGQDVNKLHAPTKPPEPKPNGTAGPPPGNFDQRQ
jgi:hypothetical protein